MNKLYDIIIIGGGPAGWTAALYAARAGFEALVIEKMAPGGQMTLTGEIENYPGFGEGISGFALGAKMQKDAEMFGALSKFGEVLSVDFSNKIKKVSLASETLEAKAIFIATGAKAKTLGISGEEGLIGRGIHYCAHCDGRFYKDKTVMVIGGGNSAAGDAIYLSRIAKKVILVHRRDVLRAGKIYQDNLKNAKNIEILFNNAVYEFKTETKVTGALLKNTMTKETSEVLCDGIFISIGRQPETEIFKDIIDIDNNGYIIADESTKTNIDGVFAIGDVRTKALRQIVTATADGATAVHFAEEYLSNF